MEYTLTYTNPHLHYLNIQCVLPQVDQPQIEVQLPSWRPGRYELGNFAKNIQKFQVKDQGGNSLPFKKLTKDRWSIQTQGATSIHFYYNYYAIDLNAGSTYISTAQLYVNPVNCCIYQVGHESDPCQLNIQVPHDFKVAIAAQFQGVTPVDLGSNQPDQPNQPYNQHTYQLQNFHDLADSPFIASPTLQVQAINVQGVEFKIWFQGECRPNWEKLTHDFQKFIAEQYKTMGAYPFQNYDFLFQILSQKIYHGVEHHNNTVIALGPGYHLNFPHLYNELLGVSCHELFHAWNIKFIRPVEMYPYDYTQENYSRLGYVCEGVTTYYGDYFLYRAGVFDEETYLSTLIERIHKHFHNPARLNMPVADASFDTWLDGYTPGVPGRKTSIYDEGCLLAFFTDITIRRYTNNQKSLDDVMRILFNEFALQSKGYSEQDYRNAVKSLLDQNGMKAIDHLFDNYIYGTTDFEPLLISCLDYIGYDLIKTPSRKYHEAKLGFKFTENVHPVKITAVLPDSPADLAGLSIGDEITAVNGHTVRGDLHEWLLYFAGETIHLDLLSGAISKHLTLQPQDKIWQYTYDIKKVAPAGKDQLEALHAWSKA